jgi:hypothetical protein
MCPSIIDKYLNCPIHYESLSSLEFCSFYNTKKNKISKYCKPKIIRFVNYNKHTNIENWSSEQLLPYSPFKNSKNSQLGINVTWHNVYCQLQSENFQTKFVFNYKMPYSNTKEIDDSTYSKSKTSHLTNIWNDNIDDHMNDSHRAIPITNTIDVEQYDLQSNFVVQSHNELNQKLQTLIDDNFTTLSHSMMEKFEFHNLIKELNEKS